MTKPNGYFYAYANTVYFRSTQDWRFFTRVSYLESPEEAQRIADQLNRDLEQLEQLPRATLEHHPGRLTTF